MVDVKPAIPARSSTTPSANPLSGGADVTGKECTEIIRMNTEDHSFHMLPPAEEELGYDIEPLSNIHINLPHHICKPI